MQFTYRSAIFIALGIFLMSMAYILFVQYILIDLHHIHHANYENEVLYWSYISIFISFILTSILLLAFVLIIKIRIKEAKSHIELKRLYIENRLYFDNAAVGFLIVNSKREVLNVNPMFCSMFGYKREEVISKSVEIFHIDNDHFMRWGREVFKKAQQSEVIRIRYPMRKKDGTKIFVEVSGAPFNENHTRHDGGVVWTATDISHNVGRENMIDRLNKELENALIYFKNMLSIAPMPIFVKDENFCYQECNEAFLKLFSKEKSEVIGAQSSDFLPADIAIKIDKNDTKVMEKEAWYYTQKMNIDNKDYCIDMHKSPIVQEGKFSGIVGIAVNVTRREEEQLYLNRRVEEELAKNRIQEKQYVEGRMQDAKFSVIGQLSAGITHEINTPLTYVKGTIEMMAHGIEDLEEGELKSSLIQDNVKVMEGIERIERIVMSMREMAQVSQQNSEKVNVYSTLVTALTMAQNRSKHIVKILLQDEIFTLENRDEKQYSCFVLAQRQRLEQAWIIIINNALDELEHKGTYEINYFEIKCFEEDSHIKILFSDSGGGIDENIIDTIFEPFVSTKNYGGIGVGLNITQKIIQEHGGEIRAYNHNNGAVIEVSLPVVAL